MAAIEKQLTYAAPGETDSPVELKPRYENFIGGHWVAAGQGRVLGEPHAGDRRGRSPRFRVRRRRTSSSRSTRRTRPRTRGARRRPPSARRC